MRKRIIIPTIALIAILGAVTVGTVSVSAQSPLYGNLVTEIAQRFNLKESDVQDVVNEVRKQRVSSFQTKWQDRLSQLVSEGKITDSQKQAIITKEAEVKSKLEALKEIPASERKAKIKQIMDDLAQWASTNKIDMRYMRMGGMYGYKRGFAAGYKMGKSS